MFNGSTAVIDIVTLTTWGLTLESDVYRPQILTSKVDPLAVRIEPSRCVIIYFFY